MRITVNHSTVYRYESPVYLEPQIFRLRPRDDGSQRLLSYAIEISPRPAGQTQCLDQDGNVIVQAWFAALAPEMAVRTTFQIETLRENPFDFLVTRADRKLPMVYEAALRGSLAPYLQEQAPEGVREFAEGVARDCEWQTMDFLFVLNQRLLAATTQVIRHEGAPLEPGETLRTNQGSCRDLAVLFCAACRAMGIAARFVSGYECDAALKDRGDLHAWAEVYLQGGGWRGYDPSRGLAVGTSHVALAAAADPALAAPISGSFRGQANSTMQFQIDMQVE